MQIQIKREENKPAAEIPNSILYSPIILCEHCASQRHVVVFSVSNQFRLHKCLQFIGTNFIQRVFSDIQQSLRAIRTLLPLGVQLTPAQVIFYELSRVGAKNGMTDTLVHSEVSQMTP
jgi:hypothetical protein